MPTPPSMAATRADDPGEDGPVLVTGAAGFIGSHVAERLVSLGRQVIGVDNFDPFYDRDQKARNLACVERAAARQRGSRFTAVEADITDAAAMGDIFARARPATVIHLAARAGVRPSLADPVGYARVNVLGTAAVFEAGRAAGVGRFVVASSSSVYGNNEKTPFAEEDDCSNPISPYASTKRACELLARTHQHLTRTPVACLRFFTVYGPRQRPDLAIAQFMSRVARGEPITVFGDGSMSRDYTYIDDIVEGVLAAAAAIDRFGCRIWNLGSDRPVRLDEMVAAVEAAVGRLAIIDRRPVPPGDVRRTWADLSRAAAELGFRPRTPFAEGLARQRAWMAESL